MTNRVRLKPDTTGRDQIRLKPVGAGSVPLQRDQGLQPWQFFVLAALGLSTAVTFMVRGQGVLVVIMLSVLMATTAIAGIAALRVLRPLVSDHEDRTPMIGERTRAALEREKMLALRAIKELEFDRAMGKLSDADWKEMSDRLRARAARLIRQLDMGSGYREQIERDVAKRLSADPPLAPPRAKPSPSDHRDSARDRVCASCSMPNDSDARFCKNCGQKLAG